MNAWIDGLLQIDEVVQVFRIVLACLLGAFIGFEREKYGRPAGLRTHMIVCVASALAMLVSIFGFEGGDPARLAAQVISGIGFIGAGAIIVRGDKDIMGITTAATIWMCAIIGLACGNGYYSGAIIATLVSLIILTCFVGVESNLSKKRKYKSSMVALIRYDENVIDKVRVILDNSNITLNSLDYKNTSYEGEKVVKVTLNIEKHVKVHELNELLMTFDKEFDMVQCKVSNDGIDVKKKQRVKESQN